MKIYTTHSTSELDSKKQDLRFFSFLLERKFSLVLQTSPRFLKVYYMIDPLANQDFAKKEQNRSVFLFSFVKTAICIIATLFEGADLFLHYFSSCAFTQSELIRRNNLFFIGPATG